MKPLNHRSRRGQAGMTLLEVTVASAVLSAMILMTLGFMMQASDEMIDTTNTAFAEADVDMAANSILDKMRESRMPQMLLYRYTKSASARLEFVDGSEATGLTEVAFVFPTPRNNSGQYIVSSGPNINPSATWMGIVVYAPYNETIGEYVDYNPHAYSDTLPISISSITASTITLSDGTTFPRDGAGMALPESGAMRTFRKVLSNVVRVEVAIASFPPTTMGSYNPLASFSIDIWSRDPTRADSAGETGMIPIRQLAQLDPQPRN